MINTAVGLGVANSVTQGMFNANLMEFITGRVNGAYNPGRDGSHVLTLPELFGAGPGGIGGNFAGTAGQYDNLANTLKTNFQNNFATILGGVILIPVGAKIATKLLRKPVLTPVNKMLKMAGLSSEVKV